MKFPKMHIAESVVNRIMNAWDELQAAPSSLGTTQLSKSLPSKVHGRGGAESEWQAVQSWLKGAPAGSRVDPNSWAVTTPDGETLQPPPEVEEVRARYFDEAPDREAQPVVPDPGASGAEVDAGLMRVQPAGAGGDEGARVASGAALGNSPLESLLGG